VQRAPFDFAGYVERIQTGPCFICEMVRGNLDGNYLVYQDEVAVVFLNKYPTLRGYALVAPRAHREHATGDFTLGEYLALQRYVYLVGEAVRRLVPTERLYVLSLGSQQGNRHVHWHLAPLPPGVPFEQQQLEALNIKDGVVAVPRDEVVGLAERLRAEFEALRDAAGS
jgi:ATP adenylyltransferase